MDYLDRNCSIRWIVGILGLLLASSAAGQVDASALRAKYGAPLNRETFTVRAGIEMIVDYSPTSTQACRLELPGEAPMPEDAAPGVGVNIHKPIDDLMEEIVPLSMRGKEQVKMCSSTGVNSMCSIQYDKVSIVETFEAGRRGAVIAKFKVDCVR